MIQLTALQQKLTENAPNCCLKYKEPLSKHTSFRIGGEAEVMAFPKTADELAEILNQCDLWNTLPVILGAGTNVLPPDEAIPGVIICLKDCMDGMQQLNETDICVMAGVTMTRAAVFAANLGLSGLEFAHGIPGTVGGGVFMNAGAYGGQISDVCTQVTVMTRSGQLRQVSAEEMMFSYRHSAVMDSREIVVSAVFHLEPKPQEAIRAVMKELMSKRSASQPLDLPSAGSAFKRPEGAYAAALIDQAGLKGYRVGNAAISAKHAGFAVNLGGATARDVRALLQQVSDIVYERSGYRLEPEIQIW